MESFKLSRAYLGADARKMFFAQFVEEIELPGGDCVKDVMHFGLLKDCGVFDVAFFHLVHGDP